MQLGVSCLVVECRTRNFQVAGSNLTAGHLQATLSKKYLCPGQLSLLPFTGWKMSSSLRAIPGEGLMWLIETVVCMCAAPRAYLFVSSGNVRMAA